MNEMLSIAKKVNSKCMGLKQGEEFLVITDSNKINIAHYFIEASRDMGISSTLVEINPQTGGELPPLPESALRKADCCIILTTSSFSHTRSRATATKLGCRIASIPGVTEEIVRSTFGADYDEIEKISVKLADMFTQSEKVRITTNLGTDIIFNIKSRKGTADTGKLTTTGAFGNLPAGEAMVAPVENFGTGRVVVDGVIAHVGILDKPIILELINGQIVSIEGDEGKLSNFLNRFDKNVDKIAEIGIGTNRLATICSNPLVDEKVYSTIHLGFGNNLFMGGNQDCNMHFDMIITKPTMYLDDTCIISDGKHIYTV